MSALSPHFSFQATPAASSIVYTPGPSVHSVRAENLAIDSLEKLVIAGLSRDEILGFIGYIEHVGHVGVDSIFHPIFAVSSERRVELLNDLITPESSTRVANGPTNPKTNHLAKKRPGPPATPNLIQQLDITSKRKKKEEKKCPFCGNKFKQAYWRSHFLPDCQKHLSITVEEEDLIACWCCRSGNPDDPNAAFGAPKTTFIGTKAASKHVEDTHASSKVRPDWSLDNAIRNILSDPWASFHSFFQTVETEEAKKTATANGVHPTLFWEMTRENRILLENLQHLGGKLVNKAGTSIDPLQMTREDRTSAVRLVQEAYRLARKHREEPPAQAQSIPEVVLSPEPLVVSQATGGASTANTPYIPPEPITAGNTPIPEQPSPSPNPTHVNHNQNQHHNPTATSPHQAQADHHKAALAASELGQHAVQINSNSSGSQQLGTPLHFSGLGSLGRKQNGPVDSRMNVNADQPTRHQMEKNSARHMHVVSGSDHVPVPYNVQEARGNQMGQHASPTTPGLLQMNNGCSHSQSPSPSTSQTPAHIHLAQGQQATRPADRESVGMADQGALPVFPDQRGLPDESYAANFHPNSDQPTNARIAQYLKKSYPGFSPWNQYTGQTQELPIVPQVDDASLSYWNSLEYLVPYGQTNNDPNVGFGATELQNSQFDSMPPDLLLNSNEPNHIEQSQNHANISNESNESMNNPWAFPLS